MPPIFQSVLLRRSFYILQQRYEYTKLQRSNSLKESPSDGLANENQFGAAKSSSDNAKGSRQPNPRLTEERIRRLESIGFHWKVKHKMKRYYDKQWESMFDRLKAFKEVNGHCVVPKRYPPDVKLGTWVRIVFSFGFVNVVESVATHQLCDFSLFVSTRSTR